MWASRSRLALTTLAYVFASTVALGISEVRDAPLLTTSSWMAAPSLTRGLASVAAGLVIAAFTVAATPPLTRRFRRLRDLHAELRPAIVGQSDGALLYLALASGISEELLFRGALVPLMGIGLSSVVFGALHQIPGRGRWVWPLWAGGMGLVFALVYRATGTLAGPIVAHVTINAFNLRFVRDGSLVGGALKDEGASFEAVR